MADEPINKTMDREDLARPDCAAVIEQLADLRRRLAAAGVAHSSWYGQLAGPSGLWERVNRGPGYRPWPGWDGDDRVPWFLLWEIAWLAVHTPLQPGQRVLDLGGAGSLFSCYLADRGCEVTSVDLDERLTAHADRLAAAMGWTMRGLTGDMAELDLPDVSFDHVFSVCVLEHLPVPRRRRAAGQWRRLLSPGGTVGLTFDYQCPDAGARIDRPADLQHQIIEPSGLAVRGNAEFLDDGTRYLESPHYAGFGRAARLAAMASAWMRGRIRRSRLLLRHRHYTFGALFLQKPL